jgi:hypothetical protein
VSKGVLLPESVGQLEERLLQVRVTLEEANNDDLVLFQELVKLGDGLELLGAGSNLGAHVLDETVSLAGSIVVLRRVATPEDLERGVAGDAVLVTSLLACFGTVNLHQLHWGVVGLQEGGSLFIFWFQFLAVAAPGN